MMIPTHKEKTEEVENIYQAMQNNDLAEAVLGHNKTAEFYEMLKPLYMLQNDKKSEELSNMFRSEGNAQFKVRNLQKALNYYNKALMFAPEDSLAMKSAYSNRSAIFLEYKLPAACLSDLEKCLSMDCPEVIKAKLLKRQKQARELMVMDCFMNQFIHRSNKYKCDFFKLGVRPNPDIPCAIADLEVIIENNMPKVIAKNDIKVGTVLAIETAFVNCPHSGDKLMCCHYCNKMRLNLIPCPGCAHTLFCNKECMMRSFADYHSIECLIINAIHPVYKNSNAELALKATLKIKNESKSWKEFIKASHSMGQNRVSQSSISDIYDSKNPFSLLTFSEKLPFIYGKMYNIGAVGSFIIKTLKEVVPSFFPQSHEERDEAVKAFARIFLYLAVYGVPVALATCVSDEALQTTSVDKYLYGLFSFCSKLKMTCHANALTVSLNKDLALVAMQPIPAGTEITIPFIESWQLADNAETKNKLINHLYDKCCDCNNCITLKNNPSFASELNSFQVETLRKLDISRLEENFDRDTVKDIFRKVCAKMHIFSNIPHSADNIVYNLFRKCILHMQDLVTDNKIVADV